MNKSYDILLGRLDGWHTFRIAQKVDINVLNEWLNKGYRIETEHQIGASLYEVYLVK